MFDAAEFKRQLPNLPRGWPLAKMKAQATLSYAQPARNGPDGLAIHRPDKGLLNLQKSDLHLRSSS